MQFTPTQKRAAAWTAIAVLALLALRSLGPVLTPFIIASVLAYALTPLVDRLDALWRGRMPRILAVIVVELLLLVTIGTARLLGALLLLLLVTMGLVVELVELELLVLPRLIFCFGADGALLLLDR